MLLASRMWVKFRFSSQLNALEIIVLEVVYFPLMMILREVEENMISISRSNSISDRVLMKKFL